MPKKQNDYTKPTAIIQGMCLVALVALAYIDGNSAEFEVNTLVYAIIAGVLFGIGNIKNILGNGK